MDARDKTTGRFLTGNNGGPGRSKGSKNKFQEQFWRDLAQLWEEQGMTALQKVLRDDTSTFVRVAAGLLPKEEEHKVVIEGLRWQTEEETLQSSRTALGDNFDLSTIDVKDMPSS